MKGALALMALPTEKLPLAGLGEQFAQFVSCGEGPSKADRYKSLGVILSSMYQSIEFI